MNIAKEYKDDPELAKTFGEEAAKDEQKLKDEQDRLERDAAFLAAQQRSSSGGSIAILAVLVAGVGLVGIVFTHKVAGPDLQDEAAAPPGGRAASSWCASGCARATSSSTSSRSSREMVAELRRRQEAEIARVDRILEKLSDAPALDRGLKEFDEDGVEMLRQLRREMQEQLEA